MAVPFPQIAKLDAGYQFGKEFQNQVVPMLTNVLQVCVSLSLMIIENQL